MSVLGDVQAYNIGFAYETGIVLQGEAETIVFEKRGSGNALMDLMTVEKFRLEDTTSKNLSLPPDVDLEISVHEDNLSLSQIAGFTSIRHGSKRYRMVRNQPLPPTANIRFWRFWLALQETV